MQMPLSSEARDMNEDSDGEHGKKDDIANESDINHMTSII